MPWRNCPLRRIVVRCHWRVPIFCFVLRSPWRSKRLRVGNPPEIPGSNTFEQRNQNGRCKYHGSVHLIILLIYIYIILYAVYIFTIVLTERFLCFATTCLPFFWFRFVKVKLLRREAAPLSRSLTLTGMRFILIWLQKENLYGKSKYVHSQLIRV